MDSDMEEDNRHIIHDDNTGELIVLLDKEENNNEVPKSDADVIPESTWPKRLPIVTEEELLEKQVVVTPVEEVPAWRKEKRTEEEEKEERYDRGRKRRRTETNQQPEISRRRIFELPSDDDEDNDTSRTVTSKYPICPISGCEGGSKSLRNHVNKMHLPRVMWDNINPPVKPEKYDELNKIRAQVLLFLAQTIVGSADIYKLLCWVVNRPYPLIPKRSVAIARHIEQMRDFTHTMCWNRPVYNRYTLYPPNHTSVLIHWRYQVALLQFLQNDEIDTYMNVGREFFEDHSNFEQAIRRDRIVVRKDPDWDEAEEQLAEIKEEVVTLDEYGTTDEMSEPIPMAMDKDDGEDMEVTRKVVLGGDVYQLLLRGSSLSFHRRSTSSSAEEKPAEETPKENPTRQIRTAVDVYDSHFHIDRTSKRLFGNTNLEINEWLEEPMERPPMVPVNVIGGLMIFCDPECFPKTVPVEDKWKVPIGVHPKKVVGLTVESEAEFLRLIESSRVTAVGEIGLDRTDREENWTKQIDFLQRTTPKFKKDKPVILHVRSNRFDRNSTLLYLLLLKLLEGSCNPQQKFILHCFTGQTEVATAWLKTFPNTHFGFTYMVKGFNKDQKQALQQIPNDRLLAETDSPYITPSGISTNSPIYIGEVIQEIGTIRGQTTEHVARLTTINASALF